MKLLLADGDNIFCAIVYEVYEERSISWMLMDRIFLSIKGFKGL
jgi:hypothetical protein